MIKEFRLEEGFKASKIKSNLINKIVIFGIAILLVINNIRKFDSNTQDISILYIFYAAIPAFILAIIYWHLKFKKDMSAIKLVLDNDTIEISDNYSIKKVNYDAISEIKEEKKGLSIIPKNDKKLTIPKGFDQFTQIKLLIESKVK